MSSTSDPRLQRLLGGVQLASLRTRLRRRFERAPSENPFDQIRIDQLNPIEHAAMAALLGRPARFSNSMQVDLHRIDTTMQQAGIATSLRDALEKLDGPIVHLATARRQALTQWSSVIEGCTFPPLIEWLQAPACLGLLKRLANQDPDAATALRRRAEAVLRTLPAKGIARSQLAAQVLGDAHALDNGQGTATLVLAVWRQVDSSADSPVDEDRVRDVWARAGVLVNELARPALFLNLPATGNYRSGEPSYAALRRLLRSPPEWNVAGRTVYVCENPNLVAIAADHLGADCAPLVCTDGMPAAAQRQLLSQLAQQGALLRYHGDFDWPGLGIANHVMREHGAQPWRLAAADYMTAVRSAASPPHPLKGAVVEASWEPALTASMRELQIAIAEEALAASLLQDLSLKDLGER